MVEISKFSKNKGGTLTTRLGTVLRYVPSAKIDLGTVPNTAYRTEYRASVHTSAAIPRKQHIC